MDIISNLVDFILSPGCTPECHHPEFRHLDLPNPVRDYLPRDRNRRDAISAR